MTERKKPDFKRHALPPVSKRYLFRIIFYVILLSVIVYIALSTIEKKNEKDTNEVHEIELLNLEIEQ